MRQETSELIEVSRQRSNLWEYCVFLTLLVIAPSWSWALVDGPIHFPLSSGFVHESSKIVVVVEDCTVKISGKDPFGEVSGGFLRLRGAVLDILSQDLDVNPNFYPDNEENLVQSSYRRRCIPIAEEKPWYEGHSAHCLILAPNENSSYLRVGLLHCSAEEFQSMHWVGVFKDISITLI